MILQQNREALERQDALKRKLLAICDSESVYAKNLMECFSQSEDMGYRVRVFSDAGQLFQYGKQHTIDLLLMGDQYPEEMRGKIPAKQRILLTRVEESAESRLEKVSASGSVTGKKEAEKRSEGVSGKRSEVSEKLPTSERWVYKYQAASKILQEILVMIREPQKQKNERKLTQTQAEGLIGVYSPVHRIGKTGFALKLGEQLGEEQPVLYLNLEEYAGVDHYLPMKEDGNLSDLLYYARQEDALFGLRIGKLVVQRGSLDYICPMPVTRDLRQVRAEEWLELLEKIRHHTIYQTVILDLGDSIQGLFEILRHCDRIYSPVINEAGAREKMAQYVDNVKRLGYEEILEHTIQEVWEKEYR